MDNEEQIKKLEEDINILVKEKLLLQKTIKEDLVSPSWCRRLQKIGFNKNTLYVYKVGDSGLYFRDKIIEEEKASMLDSTNDSPSIRFQAFKETITSAFHRKDIEPFILPSVQCNKGLWKDLSKCHYKNDDQKIFHFSLRLQKNKYCASYMEYYYEDYSTVISWEGPSLPNLLAEIVYDLIIAGYIIFKEEGTKNGNS